jgi:hypothetical protein
MKAEPMPRHVLGSSNFFDLVTMLRAVFKQPLSSQKLEIRQKPLRITYSHHILAIPSDNGTLVALVKVSDVCSGLPRFIDTPDAPICRTPKRSTQSPSPVLSWFSSGTACRRRFSLHAHSLFIDIHYITSLVALVFHPVAIVSEWLPLYPAYLFSKLSRSMIANPPLLSIRCQAGRLHMENLPTMSRRRRTSCSGTQMGRAPMGSG